MNSRFCVTLACLTALLAFAFVPTRLRAADVYSVAKTFEIGGEGSWDYATLDEKGEFLYLPRESHTIVVQTSDGKVIGDITGSTGTHGVALVPDLNRGFVTDGEKGSVLIFDLKTYATLGTVTAADDADGVIYDPATKHVYVACGDANSLVAIPGDVDPKSGKADATLDLGGKPEFLVADGAGKVYVNLTDKGEVVVVDAKAMKVLNRWPIAPGARATGLSIDREKGRLYIGCRNQHFVVMSTADGKVLADFPIGTGVDATVFDAGLGMASCIDGTLTIVGETLPGKFEVVQTLKTAAGARTMAIDHHTGTIYMPCAEMIPATTPGGRGTPKPGTFKVLVVEKAAK